MDSLPFLHLDMQSLLVIRGEMYAWSGQMCLWCVGVEGFIGHFMEVPGPIRMKSAKHDVVNVLQHQLYWIMQIQVLQPCMYWGIPSHVELSSTNPAGITSLNSN